MGWIPALQFVLNEHLSVLAEPSEETAYPRIFRLRHAEILNIPRPIAIYAVCPLEVSLKTDQQEEIGNLEEHGYGLLVVARDGSVSRRFSAIPLVQQLPIEEYKNEIRSLPTKLRRRIAISFDNYRHNPASGVTDITEVVEGIVLKAGREAAATTRKWISRGEAKPGYSAGTLDALAKSTDCAPARAAIGGVRGYIDQYRHTSHHFPKDKRQAYVKYGDCKHAFLDGMKQIKRFRVAMKNIGLSGNLP